MNPKKMLICFLGLLFLLFPKTILSVDLYNNDNSDFIIEGTVLKGLTEQGKQKLKDNGSGRIAIPWGITEVAAGAFYENKDLKIIQFTGHVNYIGEGAFYGCVNLSEVLFDATESLVFGTGSFYGCVNLKTVTLKATTIDFRDHSFEGCKLLQNVPLPDGAIVKLTIGNSAFRGCEAFIDIVLPEQTIKIGDYAFWDCIRLRSMDIPNGVSYIGDNVFAECVSLNTIINRHDGEHTKFTSSLPSHKHSSKIAKGYSANTVFKQIALKSGYAWYNLETGETIYPGTQVTPTPDTDTTPTPDNTPAPTPDGGNTQTPSQDENYTPPSFDISNGNLVSYDFLPVKYNLQAVVHGEKNISYSLTAYQKLLMTSGGSDTQSFSRVSTLLNKTGKDCFIYIK